MLHDDTKSMFRIDESEVCASFEIYKSANSTFDALNKKLTLARQKKK